MTKLILFKLVNFFLILNLFTNYFSLALGAQSEQCRSLFETPRLFPNIKFSENLKNLTDRSPFPLETNQDRIILISTIMSNFSSVALFPFNDLPSAIQSLTHIQRLKLQWEISNLKSSRFDFQIENTANAIFDIINKKNDISVEDLYNNNFESNLKLISLIRKKIFSNLVITLIRSKLSLFDELDKKSSMYRLHQVWIQIKSLPNISTLPITISENMVKKIIESDIEFNLDDLRLELKKQTTKIIFNSRLKYLNRVINGVILLLFLNSAVTEVNESHIAKEVQIESFKQQNQIASSELKELQVNTRITLWSAKIHSWHNQFKTWPSNIELLKFTHTNFDSMISSAKIDQYFLYNLKDSELTELTIESLSSWLKIEAKNYPISQHSDFEKKEIEI